MTWKAGSCEFVHPCGQTSGDYSKPLTGRQHERGFVPARCEPPTTLGAHRRGRSAGAWVGLLAAFPASLVSQCGLVRCCPPDWLEVLLAVALWAVPCVLAGAAFGAVCGWLLGLMPSGYLSPMMLLCCLPIILSALQVRPYPSYSAWGCKGNLKNIGTALEMYCTDNNGRYPPTMALLRPEYLRSVPTCPHSRWSRSTDYVAVTGSNPDLYTVVCTGSHPDRYYPQYTSVTGLIERP